MKVKTSLFLTFFLSVFLITNGNAQDQSHKDSLNTIIDQYYQLNLDIFKASSSKAEIDKLFTIFTDDFKYIHPQYGGEYSREDLYNGYVKNQANGRYNGGILDVKISNRVAGLNAVVIEKSFVTEKDGIDQLGESQMTLFEFKDGKISRIYEYW
ncbi:nuclear transport factor 2 family protein [Fulvivirga sp. RKSG066]|uniref:nuclear transport factor 2 family protein n=1 Tax=Fulvivirga aurantia TaxID=2529383 RepID=UPI0012BBC030|nr:nuclear transport factor 2 family protein [Fulvivirga aurantia]MTI21690.1 nuclear transport factor 2 family protein [Fulvivirga aurantia]